MTPVDAAKEIDRLLLGETDIKDPKTRKALHLASVAITIGPVSWPSDERLTHD